MKLENWNGNVAQLHIETAVGSAIVLFSYDTPVAVAYDGIIYRTNKKWSRTTVKHINAFIPSIYDDNENWEKEATVKVVKQADIEKFCRQSVVKLSGVLALTTTKENEH